MSTISMQTSKKNIYVKYTGSIKNKRQYLNIHFSPNDEKRVKRFYLTKIVLEIKTKMLLILFSKSKVVPRNGALHLHFENLRLS